MTPSTLEQSVSKRFIEWIDGAESQLFWAAAAMVLVIALLDGLVFLNLSLGPLYLLPLIVFSCVLNKRWLIAISLLFSLFRQSLSPPTALGTLALRFVTDGALFALASWFISELISNRRLAIRLVADLQNQVELRARAEADVQLLVELAPLGILTVDDRGYVARANAMAGTLFGGRPNMLVGLELARLVPMLARLPERSSATLSAQCSAFRLDSEIFLANVWFRRMEGGQVGRTVVLISDESDNVRLRRDEALELGVSGSRALLTAMAVHVQQALEASAELHTDPELPSGPLARLRSALRQLHDLTPPPVAGEETSVGPVNPSKLMQEFRAFCAPMFEDLPVRLTFDVPERLPLVSSNYSAIIQLLLVLVRMAHRRLRQTSSGEVRITGSTTDSELAIELWDTGLRESAESESSLGHLFTSADGLALFVARASLRAAGGDVKLETRGDRTAYVVRLPLIAPRTAGWTAASNGS